MIMVTFLSPDTGKFFLHGDLRHRIQRAKRLVQQKDFGLYRQCAGNTDTLRHAARKLPGIGAGEIREPNQRNVMPGPFLGALTAFARVCKPKATLPSTVSQGSSRGSWKMTARSCPRRR
jgi:hypothetical protein